jgi:hypothetical protein
LQNSEMTPAMNSSGQLRPVLTLAFLLLASLPNLAFPQSDSSASAESGETAPESSDYSPVLYVDVPFVFEPGTSPQLPPPVIPAEPVVSEDDPVFAQRAANIEEYSLSVGRIEADGGAWDVNLVETLIALGDLQQAQGDHGSAVATLDRALHIHRINSGLHTTEQVEIVQELIESYLVLEDWASTDLYQNYLFYIQQRAYGANDPRMIPVLGGLARWNLEAFELGFGEPLGRRLSTANILYNAAARLLSVHYGKADDRFIVYQNSIVESAFLISTNSELMSEVDKPQHRSGQELLREQLNERAPIIPLGFSAGESALLEIIAVHETANDELKLAEARTHLGDWYLLSERRRRAEEQYAVAWNLLEDKQQQAETDAAEVLAAQSAQARLFGRVTPIPVFSQYPRWVSSPRGERPPLTQLQSGEVDLSFNVTRSGQVRDVEILSEETEETSGHYGRVSRELRRFRFRPRVQDGVAIESENNRVRFRFWY